MVVGLIGHAYPPWMNVGLLIAEYGLAEWGRAKYNTDNEQ
jgi:hypothetical protein